MTTFRTITDHSNEANVVQISRTGYPTYAYTHQGWFIDDDKQDFLISDDELDEEVRSCFSVAGNFLQNPLLSGGHHWYQAGNYLRLECHVAQ
jgi:hypothetical protein